MWLITISPYHHSTSNSLISLEHRAYGPEHGTSEFVSRFLASLSTCWRFSDKWWHVTMFPPVLNSRSEGELVAGIHRYFLTSTDIGPYKICLIISQIPFYFFQNSFFSIFNFWEFWFFLFDFWESILFYFFAFYSYYTNKNINIVFLM